MKITRKTAVFILISFVIVVIIAIVRLGSPKTVAANKKPQILCDVSSASSCSTKKIPKGVCIPGGTCTHS